MLSWQLVALPASRRPLTPVAGGAALVQGYAEAAKCRYVGRYTGIYDGERSPIQGPAFDRARSSLTYSPARLVSSVVTCISW